MATKTLRVTLADILGPAGPAGRVHGEVWADFVDGNGAPRVVRYTDGTVVVPAKPRKVLDSSGVADFAVVPSDDLSIHVDDRGFGVRIGWDLKVRAARGASTDVKSVGTVVQVVTADPTIVQFGLKAPYVPVIPGAAYATSGELSAAVTPKADKVRLPLNVLDYGAVGDGVTDDTAAIQSAVNACPAGGVVEGQNKTYLVTAVSLKSDMTFRNFKFLTKPGAVELRSPVTVGADNDTTLRKNITIRNVVIDGQRAGQTGIGAVEDGGRHGFRFIGRVEDVLIEDCQATNCASDGLSFFHGQGMTSVMSYSTGIFKRIKVNRCKFNGNRRHGVSADCIDGLLMTDVEMNGNGLDVGPSEGELGDLLGGNLYGNGMDVEEYNQKTWAGNIELVRCVATGNAKQGFLAYSGGILASDVNWVPRSGYRFRDCTFDNGVSVAATDYAIDITPLAANKALGWYFDDVVIEGCDLRGSVGLRSVKNAWHHGGKITSPNVTYMGLADTVQSLVVTAPRGGKKWSVTSSTVKYLTRDDAEVIFLAAASFIPIGDTPTQTIYNFVPMWAMSDGAFDRLGATFHVPTDWVTVDVDLLYTNLTASGGNVVWRVDLGSLQLGALIADATSGGLITGTPAAQNRVTNIRMATGKAVTGGSINNAEVVRFATDAADTLAADICFIGLKLTRAS